MAGLSGFTLPDSPGAAAGLTRLLKLPAAWTGFIDTNTTGTSCLGPLAGLQGQLATYRASLDALANASLTTLVLVTRPEGPRMTNWMLALLDSRRCFIRQPPSLPLLRCKTWLMTFWSRVS